MVEQVGRVYSARAAACFHAPDCADVIMRNPVTWQSVAAGYPGIIEVMSLLSHDYPEHALSSQERGVARGVDAGPRP